MKEYQLQIKNFQSIKNQEIILKGFTVIEGASDTGKSSMRRALSSLLYNDWDNSFLREGSRSCEISLSCEDFRITQYKGSANSYTVEVNGKTKNYDKVGTETPDSVKQLGFSFFETANEAYNTTITTQLESLFMVTYRDVENTRILNKLFNIDLFGVASGLSSADIISINRSKTSAVAEKNSLISLIPSLQKQIDTLSETKDKLTRLLNLIEALDKAIKSSGNLANQKKKLKKINSFLGAIPYYIDCLSDGSKFVQSVSQKSKLEREGFKIDSDLRLYDIGSLLGFLFQIESKRVQSMALIKDMNIQLKVIESKQTLVNVYNKVSVLQKYNKSQETSTRLNSQFESNKNKGKLLLISGKISQIKGYINTSTSLSKYTKQIEEIDISIDSNLKALKAIDVCPLCMSKLEGGIQ